MDSRDVDAQLENAPLFRRLAYSAVMDHADDTLVVAAVEDLVAARDMDGKLGAIVVRLGDPSLAERLGKLLRVWQVGATSIVVIGDEEAAEALKSDAPPPIRRGRLIWHGVSEDGARWDDARKGPLGAKLDDALAPGRALDWESFEDRLRRSVARNTEQRAFAQRLYGTTPIVTYALLTANLMMFGLQAALGGFDPSVRLLIRLGGIEPHSIMNGEVWRLVSGAFLHGGVMHLGFNMMVLVILGRFVERLLGPARFLVLYTACALAGSLASTFLMDAAVSVGASGALWGILAAEAVFAFAPGFLPPPMVALARRTALINLGLNVAASFRPHVDWAAHAGGGLVGALLLYFVLSRGVPRGDRIAHDRPTPLPGQNIVAGLCVALLVGGAVAGPVLGGAFEPAPTAPIYERVVIDGTTATVQVPSSLAPQPAEVGDDSLRVDQSFGDLLHDPASVGVAIISVPPIPDDTLDLEITSILEALGEAPPSSTVTEGARRRDDTSLRAAASASYRYESDARHDVYIGIAERALIRVDVISWPDGDAFAAGLARHVVESYRDGAR
ncbi:MAG: hypothetical protein SangKO_034650 [Sandaracinaceae bacterium]